MKNRWKRVVASVMMLTLLALNTGCCCNSNSDNDNTQRDLGMKD